MAKVTTHVISKVVACPVCGAQPGEDCTEGSFDPPYVQSLPMGRGHAARTQEVVTDDDEARPPWTP